MEHRRYAHGSELSCEQLRDRHGDYVDGLLSAALAARVSAHLAACATCARYDRIVRRGLELVQELPAIAPSDDFELRLQHRIFHEQDAAAIAARSSNVSVAAAVAAMIALLAWSPLLFDERTGEPRAVATATQPPSVVPVQPLETWQPIEAPLWTRASASGMLTSGVPTAFPGPYSPLIVNPPAHGGAVRTISTEYRALE